MHLRISVNYFQHHLPTSGVLVGLLTESHGGWLAGLFSDMVDACEVEWGASVVHCGWQLVFVCTDFFNVLGGASVTPSFPGATVLGGIHAVRNLTSGSEFLLNLEGTLKSLLVADRLVVVAADLLRVLWLAMGVLQLELLVC